MKAFLRRNAAALVASALVHSLLAAAIAFSSVQAARHSRVSFDVTTMKQRKAEHKPSLKHQGPRPGQELPPPVKRPEPKPKPKKKMVDLTKDVPKIKQEPLPLKIREEPKVAEPDEPEDGDGEEDVPTTTFGIVDTDELGSFAMELETETDAEGITTTRTCDALNRVTAVTYPDSSYNVTFTYDEVTSQNGIGRLTSVTDPSGTTVFNHYQTGLLKDETITIDGTPYTLAYTYNLNGTPTAVTYPDGRQVRYTIAIMNGKPESIETDVNGSPATVMSGIAWYPFGPLQAGTYGNGITLSRTYDKKYRITTNVQGTVINTSYTHDSEMNITQITGTYNRTYSYDDLYRLTQVTYPDSETVSYAYDPMGNRTAMTSTVSGVVTYTYDAGDRLLAAGPITFTWDANGNMTGKGSATYAFDALDRLTGVVSGTTTVEFVYNGDGVRVRKAVNSTGTDYVQDVAAPLPVVVADLMTSDPITVREDEDLAHAARVMVAQSISGLPVLNASDELAGIVAKTDVVRAVSDMG